LLKEIRLKQSVNEAMTVKFFDEPYNNFHVDPIKERIRGEAIILLFVLQNTKF
jgi:hypothetical protein